MNLFLFSMMGLYQNEDFAGIPLSIILLDWNLIFRATRRTNEIPSECMETLVGTVKLNFDGSYLGNSG